MISINIIERPKINVNKLDDAIRAYSITKNNPKYLIMSKETEIDLEKLLPPYTITFPLSINKENCSCLYSYKGIKVAICDCLQFGEVDII